MTRKYGTCRANHATIVALADQGWSMSAIGRQIGAGNRHVARHMRLHQIPCLHRQVGPNNPAWKGGRILDKHGYVLIHRPDHPQSNRHGYCREHRLVMEGILGRPLLRQEVVHHRDGNPGNNAPENLALYASNGQHLAEELRGRCPNWTPQGRANILRSCRSQKERRRNATPPASETSDLPSPLPTDHLPAQPDTTLSDP